jgi:hypothetical protein
MTVALLRKPDPSLYGLAISAALTLLFGALSKLLPDFTQQGSKGREILDSIFGKREAS